MKKNLLTLALLSTALSVTAQNVLFNVDPNGLFFVGENTLVYNGGGLQTKGSGIYDIHGNVMVVGVSGNLLKTRNTADTADKTDGGNIILRLNDPANHSSATTPSTYGQLYIDGLAQGDISAVVDKEFRTAKNGTYQQVALPFYNKTISSLSGAANAIGTLGKTFTNVRYSKNEVLTWNNTTAVSDNLSVASTTPKNTTYYMLGSNGLDTGNPPATMPANAPLAAGQVFTLQGVPFANGVSEKLLNAANGINFGPGGSAINSYNERYYTYHEDQWDVTLIPSDPWSAPTFGRNMYQFGNPYLTNLDLGMIAKVESGTITDNNNIPSVQGIRYDPGVVATNSWGGTTSTGAKIVNFTANAPTPVGDLGVIIKPMQTFVVKLRNNNAESGTDKTLSFDNLRRFKYDARVDGTNYSVTSRSTASVKQLGVIGLNDLGQEVARTYYVVYADAITGNTSEATTQSVVDNTALLRTYEENASTGTVDPAVQQLYQLYINEANETDYFGKEIAMAISGNEVKSLKFEIRENTQLLPEAASQLSSGVSFYYQVPGGQKMEISQDQVIAVSGNQYGLSYGKSTAVLGTGGEVKLNGTRVLYNGAIDNFIVRFDPTWKKASVSVHDLSGKLILSNKEVATSSDFVIGLAKSNAGYIVTAISEKGQKVSAKIIR